MKIKLFEEFINEEVREVKKLISKLKSSKLEWTVDGACGVFAASFNETFPKSNVMGILDKTYNPKPTIQHYFIELNGKYIDGEGEKSLTDFERKYGGISVRINDEGFEFGKEENDYSDLPDWGSDISMKREIEKLK